MKKVLIIAYYFPPLGGGGVQRPLKFCKYLPEFGWKPIVLTAKNGVGPVYDETLLDELNSYKDTKVYRTLSFELGALKKSAYCRISELANYSKKKIPKSVNPSITKSANSPIRKIFQKIYNFFFFIIKKISIPDDKILWAIPSFFPALRIIKKEKPDLIFVTIPPYSSYILAVLLKIWTGKKVIVDYRDPWNIIEKSSMIKKWLEKKCIDNCDGISVAFPSIEKNIIKQFNFKKKSVVIYNGFDGDDYLGLHSVINPKFTLISGGDLYGEDNIYFFKLLEDFFKTYPEFQKELILQIFSNYHKWFDEYMKKSPISENLQNNGILKRKEYLKFVNSANAAVIFSYGEKPGNHGRIFDYLFFSKPVILLGSDEYEIVKFTRQFKNIYYISKNSPSDFNLIFRKIIEQNKMKSLNSIENNEEILNQYERKNLTRRLNEFFKECL